MRRVSVAVFGFAFGLGIMLGAPVALSGSGAPFAPFGLSLVGDEAAAQAIADCPASGVGSFPRCTPTNIETDGEGGDARSSSGNGGPGGTASQRELVSLSAASQTSQTLSDVETGPIHNEATIIVEDTDETVVINMAGNPGSNGIHMLNVSAVPQAINTGGNNNSAAAPGGDSGDASGNGGNSRQGDINVVSASLP